MKIRIVLTAMAGLCLVVIARAETVTEADAVSRALHHTLFDQYLTARQGSAESARAASGRWHNPEITFEREKLDLPTGESEQTTLSVSQRFNLAGIKRLQRLAAGQDLDAARARTALMRRERITATRMAFYRAVLAEQRLARMSALIEELTTLESSTHARARAGDASRYDAIRMQQEVAVQSARHMRLQGEVRSARQQLQVLADVADSSILQGALLPPQINPAGVSASLAEHPLVVSLNAEADSARIQAQASARRWWPDMTLGLGQKTVTEPGLDADGQVISLGLELPLGDSGRQLAAKNRYQASQLQAERALALQELRVAESTARDVAAVNRQASEKLASYSAAGEVVIIARAAYEAGEISIMELLDAFNSSFALYESMQEHALAARHAYIEWQQLTGE